jgi:hypothetical protein
MRKFKLKEAFAGLPEGHVFTTKATEDKVLLEVPNYKGAGIYLYTTSELVEEVMQYLFISDEAELYPGGEGKPVYKDEYSYSVNITSLNNNYGTAQAGLVDYRHVQKTFHTLSAAEDYKRVNKKARELNLKVGAELRLHSVQFFDASFKSHERGSFDSNRILGFVILNGEPAIKVNQGSVYYVYMKHMSASGLTFGNKPVTLRESWIVGEVEIECEGSKSMYQNCKKFIDAARVIRLFKFGSKELKTKSGTPASESFETITIGCTIGTFKEAEAILVACEKLLKR